MDMALLLEENAQLKAENAWLKQELAQLKRLIFGQSRERFIPASPDQLNLELAAEKTEPELTSETITYTRKKSEVKPAPHGRNELPAHLERREIILEPDEDTSGMKKIGEEISEELEYEPGSLFVNRYIRPKYARPKGMDSHNESEILIAPLPSRPIEKGIAGSGLLAHILISKFVDHLPIHTSTLLSNRRLRQIFKRQDVDIPASTTDDWVRSSCELLTAMAEVHRRNILQCDYLMVDETPIRVLDKNIKGKTHLGYFWVYYSPQLRQVFFDYREGRSREGPHEVLSGFLERSVNPEFSGKGALQTDGYTGYDELGKRGDIIHLGCMAHARRYFHEARGNDKVRSEEMLGMIQALYAVEARARESKISNEERYILRQEKSVPILNEMKVWLDKNLVEVLPKSQIGKAIAYMLGRWDALTGYLRDGRYEIDNNLVENAIRPVDLGRKNYLFAGSHNGAKRAAMIYSLVATAKLQGVEPYAWLKDVLTKLSRVLGTG